MSVTKTCLYSYSKSINSPNCCSLSSPCARLNPTSRKAVCFSSCDIGDESVAETYASLGIECDMRCQIYVISNQLA